MGHAEIENSVYGEKYGQSIIRVTEEVMLIAGSE